MFDILDALPTDALTRLTLDVRGVRLTKSALARIEAAALRQTRIEHLELPLRGVASVSGRALHATPSAAELEERARQEAERAQVAALQAWVAVTQLPARVAAAMARLTLDEPETMHAVADALVEDQPEGVRGSMAELALRLLELPMNHGWVDTWEKDERRVHLGRATVQLVSGAATVLEQVRPVGVGARLVKILKSDSGTCWYFLMQLRTDISGRPPRYGVVPPSELPLFLDWYESLRGRDAKSMPIYSSVQTMVLATDDAHVFGEVWDRLQEPTRKLTAFQRGVYETIVAEAKRPPELRSL